MKEYNPLSNESVIVSQEQTELLLNSINSSVSGVLTEGCYKTI